MLELIPESHRGIAEEPIFAVLTTVMPDGQPQSSVVWWDLDGDYVRISTIRGRQKEKNMPKDAKITLLAFADPYRWLEMRGIVEEVTEEGAVDLIEKLSWKYEGKPFYGGYADAERRNTETRVIVKIRVHKVVAYPSDKH